MLNMYWNPWRSMPHRFAVEELLDLYCPSSRARTARRQWQAKLVEGSKSQTKRKQQKQSGASVPRRRARRKGETSFV
jgi:hypothetical protein